MAVGSQRRAFLRGDFRNVERPRPPGAQDWEVFADACDGCGACVDACPEQLLSADNDGFPILNPKVGACTFCHLCTEACPTDALQADQPWPWRARIGASCLSVQGVQCRTCEDHCDARAIRFRLQTGGRVTPVLDPELCTGCGGCVGPCPVGAVSLAKMTPTVEETRSC